MSRVRKYVFHVNLLVNLSVFFLHLFRKRTFEDKWCRILGKMPFLPPSQCQSTVGHSKQRELKSTGPNQGKSWLKNSSSVR